MAMAALGDPEPTLPLCPLPLRVLLCHAPWSAAARPQGRIIEDEARCPALMGEVVGNFFDERFRFIHVALNRCHNGTDSQGRTQPGPCRRPDEIDELVRGLAWLELS